MLLCVALCACTAAPSASATAAPEKGRAWSITVHQTRLAAFKTGETMLVWACSLELALLKNGGATPEGTYEGRLMVSWERDCYQAGAYTAAPAGLAGYDPALREYAWSAPLTVAVGPASAVDCAALLAAAEACDSAAQAALFGDLGAVDSPGGTAGAITLCEVDDFGVPLPALAAPAATEAEWAGGVAWVDWTPGWPPLGWGDFASEAVPLAEAAGAGGFAPALPALDQRGFGGTPPAAAAVPLWLTIGEKDTVSLWLPGLMPLEGARPFEGTLYSNGFAPASTPCPPGAYANAIAQEGSAPASQSTPEPASRTLPEDSPYRNWLAGPAPSGDAESLSGEDTPSEAASVAGGDASLPPGPAPAADPLAEALAEYNLPMPHTAIKGPKKKDGTYIYEISDFTYQDALSYARKLKMGGYKTVLSEVEQPILDLYSLVASSSGRRLSLRYEYGSARITIF